MKEQSHKSEMRDALRGDFERLRARRRSGAEDAMVAVAIEPVNDTPRQSADPQASLPVPATRSWLDRLRAPR